MCLGHFYIRKFCPPSLVIGSYGEVMYKTGGQLVSPVLSCPFLRCHLSEELTLLLGGTVRKHLHCPQVLWLLGDLLASRDEASSWGHSPCLIKVSS